MPKAKPVGLSADTKLYKSGVSMYRLLFNGEVILESSKPETRDYVLSRMQERAAERVEKLAELVLDNC